MNSLALFAEQVVSRLAWTSVQATVLVSVVWLICRKLPRLGASARSLLWWLLGVQLLFGLVAPAPVSLPLLSPSAAPAIATMASAPAATRFVAPSEHRMGGFATASPAAPTALANAALHDSSAAGETVTGGMHWATIWLALWLAGALMQAMLAARQWREARVVVRDSQPLADATLQSACAAQARAMGLRRCPELRVSPAIRSPQVSGLWHPTVLLPARHELSAEETSLALAHELTHLRRGDLWMGWVPAIAQRLFFFHPLVALAMREYALNREAACDAQVVRQHDAAPQDYGRLLLRLGVAHPLPAGLAGASPTFHNLKRRLIMLQNDALEVTPRLRNWLLVLAVAAIGVLPYRVTEARPEQPAVDSAPAAAATAAVAPMPAVAPTPAVQAVPAPRRVSTAHSNLMPTPPAPPAPPTPMAPAAPTAPSAPPAPPAPPSGALGFTAHHIDIDTHGDSGYGFALIGADAITISGSDADLALVKNLSERGQPLLWFRRGQQSYVIRDEAYIQRAKAAYAPVSALGKEQGKLGGQQGRLGAEQGRLGGEQGRLGAREGALAMRQAALSSREVEIDSMPAQGKSPESVAAATASLRASMAEIDKERAELERQQQELGKKQEALGQQQEAFGKQQEALGKRQEQAAAQANQQMERLLDEALAKGVAQPLSSR